MAALVDAYAMQEIWTTWKTEARGANATPSKVPYAIDGRLAKANDPSTWMTYFEAEQAMKNFGHDGINIMLAPVDSHLHLGCIDLDACIGEEGDIAPWAADIVVKVNSYTEVSPSGTGLKVFFLHDPALTLDPKHRWMKHVQKPNPKGGKMLGIETFLARHYQAITENLYQSYTDLRVVDIETLYAVQLVMGRFKEGDKPVLVSEEDRLYSAIDSMENPGLSWLEWSAIGMAIHRSTRGSQRGYDAFLRWSQKSSKFNEADCRERWDNWRRSPGDQVGEGTIFHHAIEAGWKDPNAGQRRPKANGHDTRYDSEPDNDNDTHNVGLIGKRRQPIFRIAEGDVLRWDGVEVPDVEMLVDNMLPLHVAGILAGDGGAGKSLLSQVLCTCVASGFAFCGRRVARGRAVYITGEDPETVLHNRQSRINESLNYNMQQLGGRLFLRSILDDDIFLFSDGRPTGLLGELISELEGLGEIKLLIIDSAAIVYDDDEIKRRPVAKFMISLNRLARRLSCTVLLITHKSRSGGSGAGSFTSGSTGWAAHARCGFDIVQTNDADDESDVVLKLVKPNYTKPIPPIALRWDRHGVLTYIPDRPTDQLELNALRTAETSDDKTLLQVIDRQWNTGTGFMKNSEPKLDQYMAGAPHNWSVNKTKGIRTRLLTTGCLGYSDNGKKRGWRVTDTGKAKLA